MGKCVRIRSKPPPSPGEAAAYRTLRSGRRVPVAACSPPGSRRHRRGSSPSCRCGGAAKRGCGSPRRRKSAEPTQLAGSDRLEEEATCPVARDVVVDGDRGDSFEPANTPLSGDAVKVKHEHGSKDGVVGRTPSPLMEAEIEAFFAAAELAERRRFAEAYNYDVVLDRPLEGRFEWEPVST